MKKPMIARWSLVVDREQWRLPMGDRLGSVPANVDFLGHRTIMSDTGSHVVTHLQALVRDLNDDIVSEIGLTLLRYVWRWQETEDPYWVDLALVETSKHRYRLPPSLQNLAVHVANLRLMGFERKGKVPKALKEEIKMRALILMASMIAAADKGEPIFEDVKKLGIVETAAAHAANAMARDFGHQHYTASTLQKFFEKECRKPMPWLEELVSSEIFARQPEVLSLLNSELREVRKLQRGNRR